MREQQSDASLWLEAETGTAAAFGEIFSRYRRRVFGSALRQTRSPDHAEEILSIVFLELWRLRHKVRIVDGSLLPWILSVTNFTCMNFIRSRRRHAIFLSKIPPVAPSPDTAEIAHRYIEQDEHRDLIRSAIGTLNDRDRTIIILCLVEELPLSVVAQTLQLPLGTVKSRLHRAKAKLRDELFHLASLQISRVGD